MKIKILLGLMKIPSTDYYHSLLTASKTLPKISNKSTNASNIISLSETLFYHCEPHYFLEHNNRKLFFQGCFYQIHDNTKSSAENTVVSDIHLC